MEILPASNLKLSSDVTFLQKPSLTWWINTGTKRIQGEVDGYEAVRQAVEIILNIERFRWQIFQPYSGMQWEGLIGKDSGYVALELQRRIKEALMVDDRITDISNFDYRSEADKIDVSFTVNTVFGSMEKEMEVSLP